MHSLNPTRLSTADWEALAAEARLPRERWGAAWIRLRMFGENLTRSQALTILRGISETEATPAIEA